MLSTSRPPGWHARTSPATAGVVRVVLLVLLLGLVGVPVGRLFAVALGGGPGSALRALTADGIPTAVLHTIETSLAIPALAVPIGAGAALLTERSAAPGRAGIRLTLLSALVAAPLVSALGWTQAYGPGGLLDHLVGRHWDGLFGPAGIVVVGSSVAVPVAYVVVAAGLAARGEPDLERAARAAGASPWQAARTVTLPLARPALAVAAALVFVSSANAFEVPVVLGIPAGFATMTTRLYSDLVLSADPAAFDAAVALATGLVVLAAAVLLPLDALLPSLRALRTGAGAGAGAGAGPGAVPGRPGPGAWCVSTLAWALLASTVGMPMAALVLTALTPAVGVAPTPATWTPGNFAAALDRHTIGALGHSLLLAMTAATILTLVGGLTAAAGRGRIGALLGTAATLPFALAGSALAVAVLLAYGPALGDGLGIILLAYLAKFWALGFRPVAGALDRLPPDLVRAARSSGAGPGQAVRTVVVPVLRPALAVAWLLVFLSVLHELTISSLLYGPGSETLAVVILGRQQLGDVGVSSALAVLLSLVLAALGALLALATRASRRSRA